MGCNFLQAIMESQRHPTPEAIFSKPGRLSGWWRANHHLDGLVLEPKTRGSSCLWKWRILFQSFPLLDFNDRFQHLEGPFSPKEGAKRCFRNCGRKTFQDCDSNKKRPGVGKAINFQKKWAMFSEAGGKWISTCLFSSRRSHPVASWGFTQTLAWLTTTNSESAMADKTLGLFCVTFTSRFFREMWGEKLRDFTTLSTFVQGFWGHFINMVPLMGELYKVIPEIMEKSWMLVVFKMENQSNFEPS